MSDKGYDAYWEATIPTPRRRTLMPVSLGSRDGVRPENTITMKARDER